MHLYYGQLRQPNFGDDLNSWLWTTLMPECVGGEQDVTFVGIGTIIADRIPRRRLRVVFSTGAGYEPVSRIATDPGWRVYCVRGPLTARVLGLSDAAVASDGAVLLRTLPEFQTAHRAGVVFVPHWISADLARWKEACELCDIEYVDPRWESRRVVARLASAELVLAESLHAAIVADAFRVPWVAVKGSININVFKWQDWCASLDVEYRPKR